MILTGWGCQAVISDTAERALAALNKRRLSPDVILADFHLQANGTGLDAIRTIQAGSGRIVPAFLFTGDTRIPPACEYPILRKPLHPDRLRTVLADTLGR
jgi:CheY-like chemotaxis protein